jgi:hypothetical protein
LARAIVQLAGPATHNAGGIAAADGGPVTRRAGAPGEVHALPGLDASAATLLEAHESAFIGDGTTLRPGDVLVTTLPNHERDIDPATTRPTVSLTGDAAVRIVALSALGEVLADETANQADVEVPAHTARLVAWCVGGTAAAGVPTAAAGSAGSAGFCGWSATDRLPHVGAGVTLGRDCVITGLAAPRRGHRNAQAGHVLLAAAAAKAQVVRTLLPAGTSVVVVSLDTAENADLAGLSIGIDGATRVVDAAGEPTPPVVVSARGRTHLLYDLEPNAIERRPTPVGVTIGCDATWGVAGVMGGTGSAADSATLLAATGAAHLLAPVLRAPTGTARLRWSAPTPAIPTQPGAVTIPAHAPVPEEVR